MRRRSEWWRQKTIENRAYKAWKKLDEFSDRVLERWLEAGNRTPEEFTKQSDALQRAIKRAAQDQQVPVGMFRLTLASMLAESVAQTAPNIDEAGEAAAVFGQTMVRCAMQIFAHNHPEEEIQPEAKFDACDLQVVERTPESEKLATVLHKSDAELLALMHAFGVCQRCASNAMALIRTSPARSKTPQELMPDEAIGFRTCSQACCDGIMTALTTQRH